MCAWYINSKCLIFDFQTTSMTKTELRQIYKEKRLALSQHQIEDLSLDIANHLLALDVWDKKFFHIFLTIDKLKEVDTSFLLHALMGKDKHIVVSKTDFKQETMTHFLLTDDLKIKPNAFGIPEPEDGIAIAVDKLDVVFVPLLVADKRGHRVGYGKGYYDRFLSNCRADVIKIGLSFFEPIDQITDIFEKDVKLDWLVTPNQIYYF